MVYGIIIKKKIVTSIEWTQTVILFTGLFKNKRNYYYLFYKGLLTIIYRDSPTSVVVGGVLSL